MTLSALALQANSAQAATLTVTTTADINAIESPCTDGNCSLRQAIIKANTDGGADIIEIPSGYYSLTLPGEDDTSAAGDLDITSEVDLKATGGIAVVDADALTGEKVFHVLGAGTARLSNLWITGGTGGIASLGNLTLTNSTVSGNRAGAGFGGIFSGVNSLTLINSTVSGNDAGGSSGGGIISHGTSTLTNSTVNRNRTTNAGGGILTVSGGTLTLTNSTVSGNRSGVTAGGVYNQGTTTVTKSTVSGNNALAGGGIYNVGMLTVTNSTVSGNQASAYGGGIANEGGTSTLTDSTVSRNRADTDNDEFGDGGGVYRSDGTLSIGNSILARNFDDSPTTTTHPDCSGEIASTNFNIFGDITGCTVTNTLQERDRVTAELILGRLAWNGGRTETHALPAESPAMNHGPATGATTTDQRGVPRPQGGGRDTGAYERALCSTQLVNVVGTSGADVLTGTAWADGALALGGNDTVRLGDGNDKACGGNGNDKLYGENGSDKLLGEAGNDYLNGAVGSDSLNGGAGNDVCVGGPGTNKLISC